MNIASYGLENPAGMLQVLINIFATLKGLNARVLNRRVGGGERLTGDNGHGVLQRAQFRRKDKRTQPPAAGSQPLTQAGADNRAFGIITGNGPVPAVELELPVNLLRQKNNAVTASHVGDGQ